jgi:hypothetical protein
MMANPVGSPSRFGSCKNGTVHIPAPGWLISRPSQQAISHVPTLHVEWPGPKFPDKLCGSISQMFFFSIPVLVDFDPGFQHRVEANG